MQVIDGKTQQPIPEEGVYPDAIKLSLDDAQEWEGKGVTFTCVAYEEDFSEFRIFIPNSLSRVELAYFLTGLESMFQDGFSTDLDFQEVDGGLEIKAFAD